MCAIQLEAQANISWLPKWFKGLEDNKILKICIYLKKMKKNGVH